MKIHRSERNRKCAAQVADENRRFEAIAVGDSESKTITCSTMLLSSSLGERLIVFSSE